MAYSTLSLKDRRSRHLAAARFFESLGDDELAGALASHYLAAYRATPSGDEAAALATQARLALRGAAERAWALGSPGQALAFLEQALEVSRDPGEEAAILERAVEAAALATHFDRALELVVRLKAIREESGDRPGLALAMAMEAEALYSARQRERSAQLVQEAVNRFEDLGDHPVMLRLLGNMANAAAFSRQYDVALAMSDRALGIAERIGNAEQAVRMLMIRGSIALFRGRLWEAIALSEGARHLAEQHGLTTMVHRANAGLTNVLALDDPRATVAIEREIIDYSRRLGRRENEIITLGNTAEDVRRTGEWDWIVPELDRAIRDADRNVTDLILELARAVFLIYRGQMTDAERDELAGRLEALEDVDVSTARFDLLATAKMVVRDFAGAARLWSAQAEGSDLNSVYALPKAAVAAVMAGDGAGAQTALDLLAARGARGRAIEADMATARAGILAIAGDKAAALAGFKTAWTAYRDLGLPWDEAMLGLAAAATLGVDDPEVAGWLGEARATFERLRTGPLIEILDGFAANVWSGRRAEEPDEESSSDGALPQAEASPSST